MSYLWWRASSWRGFNSRAGLALLFIRWHWLPHRSIASSTTSFVISSAGRSESPVRRISRRARHPRTGLSRIYRASLDPEIESQEQAATAPAVMIGFSPCARAAGRENSREHPRVFDKVFLAMIWRKCLERTMSVKLPPQVELIAAANESNCPVLHRAGGRPSRRNLRFFAERHQVGHDAEMFATPVASGGATSRTALRRKWEHFVFVADAAQVCSHSPEMIVAAFALDRFDDDRGDVDPAFPTNFMISSSDFFSRAITSLPVHFRLTKNR